MNSLNESPSISENSSQSPPHINHHCCYECDDPLKGIFCRQCTCKLCGNGAYYGYNCPPKVPIIPNPEPFNNQTIKEPPPTFLSFDSKSDLVHEYPNVFDLPLQLPFISCEFCRNDARYGHYCTPQVPFVYPKPCYNQDFNFSPEFQEFHDFQQQDLCCENCGVTHEAYQSFAITPNEPVNSLSMRDEHLDTVLATKLDEFIKSSVENLVLNPSESEGESECDVPAREEFTTFSNILFDAEYEFDSSDDQSFSDEDLPKKIYSNPLFEEEIIPMKIDPHHYNAESDLIESLRTHDSSIIISSKIDSLLDEFAGELTLLKSILPRIDETDCDPEEDIRLIERLLYSNSSPRLLEEFVFENSNAEIESLSPSPISVEDNSLSNDTLSLPEIESFYFDIPSFSHPSAKPPDSNTGISNVKMMGDNSDQKVPIPKLMITLVPNQEKAPDLLSHQGLKAF
nr:hypothetical protein [Tanacetum cinerariifolium]